MPQRRAPPWRPLCFSGGLLLGGLRFGLSFCFSGGFFFGSLCFRLGFRFSGGLFFGSLCFRLGFRFSGGLFFGSLCFRLGFRFSGGLFFGSLCFRLGFRFSGGLFFGSLCFRLGFRFSGGLLFGSGFDFGSRLSLHRSRGCGRRFLGNRCSGRLLAGFRLRLAALRHGRGLGGLCLLGIDLAKRHLVVPALTSLVQ